MKRIIAIIMAATLILALVACGKSSSKMPEGFDPNVYEYAVAAYELVRDYNKGKITYDDAIQRAKTISKNVEDVKLEKNSSKLSDSTYELINETNKMTISTSLGSFVMKLSNGLSTSDVEKTLSDLLKK